MNDISVQIGPVRFKNPVFIASGICGYAEEYSPLVNLSRLGGVVTKTITMLPRAGNLPPRIHELPHGMLNSIGLENVGLERYVKEKLPQLNQRPDVGVMVSVAAETEEEFIQLAEAFAPMDGYAGLELNLSCPNVKGEALDQGRNPQLVEKISRIVKAAHSEEVAVDQGDAQHHRRRLGGARGRARWGRRHRRHQHAGRHRF